MKINELVVLVGEKVVLVPYEPVHVPKYHSWMQNEELRQLTASEELTLDEEYDMQRKWRVDEDKLTFIILARAAGDKISHAEHGVSPTDPRVQTLDMVGDVNVFLNGPIPTSASTADEMEDFTAELEIMIAEPRYRRGGYATESLNLMLRYATGNAFPPAEVTLLATTVDLTDPPTERIDSLPPGQQHCTLPVPVPIPCLVVRISDNNIPSIKLFQRLGFIVVKHVEVFAEVEMRVRAG